MTSLMPFSHFNDNRLRLRIGRMKTPIFTSIIILPAGRFDCPGVIVVRDQLRWKPPRTAPWVLVKVIQQPHGLSGMSFRCRPSLVW